MRVGRDIRLIVHKTDVDARCSATPTTTTRLTPGLSGGSSTSIPRPAPRSSSRYARRSRRSSCRCTSRSRSRLPRCSRRCSPSSATTSCSATASRPSGSTTSGAANEDELLALADHLPEEAAEALLELATGGTPQCPVAVRRRRPVRASRCAAAVPGHGRRRGARACARLPVGALDGLPPSRRSATIVERDYGGPARVSGSAGTGKTIVALHRAVLPRPRRIPDARVLLTTYSDTLAASLANRLELLIGNEPRVGERIEVHSIGEVGRRLYRAHAGEPRIAAASRFARLRARGVRGGGSQRFRPALPRSPSGSRSSTRGSCGPGTTTATFAGSGARPGSLRSSAPSCGRSSSACSTRLDARRTADRVRHVHATLRSCSSARRTPYDFVVVDEAQDMGVAHLRFFAALGGGPPERACSSRATSGSASSSSRSRGGRSASTSAVAREHCASTTARHTRSARAPTGFSIRSKPTPTAVVESRAGTVSVFNGAAADDPALRRRGGGDRGGRRLDRRSVCAKASRRTSLASSCGRTQRSNERARAVEGGRPAVQPCSTRRCADAGCASRSSTMHLAKGLEFRAVA